MKRCSRCGEEKSVESFNYKTISKNLLQSQCKNCSRLLIRNHYNNNKNYYLQKTQRRNSEVRLKIQQYLLEYLSRHPCVDCGEADLIVLEFDHRSEEKKYKAISQLIRGRVPLEQIISEIDKCDVRCANCHRRKTAKQFNWFKLTSRP